MLSPEIRAKIQANAWPVFASLSWAFVMFIFRWEADSIQPSLRSSMKYMYVSNFPIFVLDTLTDTCHSYVDSDKWDSFRNLLIYNV